MMESTSELQKIIDKCTKMEEALKKIEKLRETEIKIRDNNGEISSSAVDELLTVAMNAVAIAEQALF